MNTEQATIGAKVRANTAFYGVAEGSQGTIIDDYGTGVTVEWDLPRPIKWHRPLRDGFDKKTELQYLDLVGGES